MQIAGLLLSPFMALRLYGVYQMGIALRGAWLVEAEFRVPRILFSSRDHIKLSVNVCLKLAELITIFVRPLAYWTVEHTELELQAM